jgi:hypothetical protein
MLNEAARAVAIADDRRAAHRRMSAAVATFVTAAGSSHDKQETRILRRKSRTVRRSRQ